MKNKFKLATLFIVIGVVLGACSSTQLVSSWKSPNASIENYKKVLVIGLMGSKDPELRLATEQKLVEAFIKKGIQAESAYTEYGPKAFDTSNEQKTIEKIKGKGYDGVFTIALLNKSSQRRYNPGSINYQPYGSYYSRFYGRFRTIYGQVYEPGYYTTSTNFVLEANFYNLNKDMLLYSAQTKAFDPGSAQSLAADLSETLLTDMMQKGFISK